MIKLPRKRAIVDILSQPATETPIVRIRQLENGSRFQVVVYTPQGSHTVALID